MVDIEEAVVLKLAYAYDLTKLYQIREKLVSNGDNLDLIDKAIAKRKKLDYKAGIKNQEKIREDKIFKKKLKKATFWGFISGLFGGSSNSKSASNGLSDWEVHEISKNNYEPMNFEEEAMDEDDFYSDDLD